MVTDGELTELASRLGSTPTLTAYVDTTGGDGKLRSDWHADVHNGVTELRRALHGASRAEQGAFDRSATRLEMRLRGLHDAARAPSWVVVIAGGDVHHFTTLVTRVPTKLHWTRGPCFAAYPEPAQRPG